MSAPPAYFFPLCALLLVLAFAGTLMRMQKWRLDAWFLAGYVALVLIWPFPDEYARFLLAAFPCILLAASTSAGRLDALIGPRFLGGAAARWTLCLLVFALMAPAGWKFAHRAALPVPEELLGDKREPGFFLADTEGEALKAAESAARARLLLIEARQVVPEDDCIYALPPQIARLYSRRRVVAYPFGLGNDPDQVRPRLTECNYFFVGVWHARRYGVDVLYPYEALRSWTEPVLVTRMKKGNGTTDIAALLRRTVSNESVDRDLRPNAPPESD